MWKREKGYEAWKNGLSVWSESNIRIISITYSSEAERYHQLATFVSSIVKLDKIDQSMSNEEE
ncbi:putative transcription regulator [Trichinella spiralis]|uniref:putative transcription regulator n=1 Tax=Trichinella spiralis TaxID=6334 RepID=UPI0001EFBD3C|nr:putative transcription regulator [Trichinella spiralis]